MSSIVHKIKEAVHGDHSKHQNAETVHHPSSHQYTVDDTQAIGNGLREHGRSELGAREGVGAGYGAREGAGYGSAEGEYGPRSSRTANAADPRVDSDLDGSRAFDQERAGGSGVGGGTHNTYQFNRYESHGHGGPRAGPTAPASSHRHEGAAAESAFHAGPAAYSYEPGNVPAGTHGPHNSRAANAADPRFDSDLDGSRTAHGDRALQFDRSRAAHGDRRLQTSTTGERDPSDAAQVPPSVLQKHVGEPMLEHSDHHHGRERRNSIKTEQENFRGI